MTMKKERPEWIREGRVLAWLSLPGLLLICDSDVGAGGAFVLGIGICLLGKLWKRVFADASEFVRDLMLSVGGVTLAIAVIMLVVPSVILLLAATLFLLFTND